MVNGKVYDVTNYIKMNKHPGGKIIIEGCGKDATELFNTKGGRGEGHSEKAWNFLENYYIGVLDKSE
ncbi:MAG: cytochrome b5-like heme/steroid binding domain-containing protein [Candidatus Woesearchaeota archaeon]